MLNHTLSNQVLEPPFTQPNNASSTGDTAANPFQVDERRPSEGWLKRPAWIDSGLNPPKYYFTHKEIEATCLAWGVMPPPRYSAPEPTVTPAEFMRDFEARIAPLDVALGYRPSPVIPLGTQYDVLSARVSPTPTNNHYREVGALGQPLGNTSDLPPSEVDGHLVNIAHIFTPTDASATLAHNAKAIKKNKTTTLGRIKLEGISRVEFIKAFLTFHQLQSKYAPGVHSGPKFKLSWTGSQGGRSGAPTILTDENFNTALTAILKKDKTKMAITVEFDTDDMVGYRIQEPLGLSTDPLVNNNGDEELLYGNRIPQVAQFNTAEQINGKFIMELKKKWPCDRHQGEHGEPGYCYINENGGHLRLNPMCLKMWSAAIASGDTTKHEPPCVEGFDGPFNGRIFSIRARGKGGPAVVAAPTNNDAMTLVMASLIPIIGGLSRKRSRSPSPRQPLSTLELNTPKRRRHDSQTPTGRTMTFRTPGGPRRNLPTPVHLRRVLHTPGCPDPDVGSQTHVQEPVPAPGFELRACLRDFAAAEHGVDLTKFEASLGAEDFTPDIIALADDYATAAIHSITGATHGCILKLKLFCKKWQTDYKRKISSGHYTTFELK